MIAHRFGKPRVSLIRSVYEQAGAGCINLGLGELQFPADDWLTRQAMTALKEGPVRYTPNAGLPELRQAIARYQGIDDYKDIVVTNGAEEAVFATLFALVDPGDEVLVPDPGFTAYPEIIEMVGGIPVSVPLNHENGFRFERESLFEKVGQHTRGMVLSNPSNPLGTVLTGEEIELLREFLEPDHRFLIVDEVYRELFVESRSVSLRSLSDQVVVVSGLSKSHAMTGWRIGWTCASHKITPAILTAHQYISTCAGWLSQKTAIAALTDQGWNVNDALRSALAVNRHYCLHALAHLYILPNQASPYLWVYVGGDDHQIALDLLNHGVITVPGRAFGRQGEGWLRIAYGLELPLLQEGIGRFRAGIGVLGESARS